MLPRIHAISHMARASYIPVHQAHAARSTMITTAATSLNAAAFARPGGALIESTSSVKVRMIPACRAPLSIGCLRRIHLLPLAWGAVTALLPISRECFSRGPLSLWYHLNPDKIRIGLHIIRVHTGKASRYAPRTRSLICARDVRFPAMKAGFACPSCLQSDPPCRCQVAEHHGLRCSGSRESCGVLLLGALHLLGGKSLSTITIATTM